MNKRRQHRANAMFVKLADESLLPSQWSQTERLMIALILDIQVKLENIQILKMELEKHMYGSD